MRFLDPERFYGTKIPSPQLLLFPSLTNRDARKSFRPLPLRAISARRIRSYENCRVTLLNPKLFSPSRPTVNPLAATLMGLPASVANKRLTVKANFFRCNTYAKYGEWCWLLLTRFPTRNTAQPAVSAATSLLRCFITSTVQLPHPIRNNHLPETHPTAPNLRLPPPIPAPRPSPRVFP